MEAVKKDLMDMLVRELKEELWRRAASRGRAIRRGCAGVCTARFGDCARTFGEHRGRVEYE